MRHKCEHCGFLVQNTNKCPICHNIHGEDWLAKTKILNTKRNSLAFIILFVINVSLLLAINVEDSKPIKHDNYQDRAKLVNHSGWQADVYSSYERIPIPTDNQATYNLIKVQQISSNLLVITRRVGSSGITFAAREINCRNYTFRYLSEGDSLEDLKRNVHDRDLMAELVTGSISYYVALVACSK